MKFYIKPQPPSVFVIPIVVVSYRNSTSNHNRAPNHLYLQELYLIEILHQTTTPPPGVVFALMLYLIEILHQTTTAWCIRIRRYSCILSKFYIKPQPAIANVSAAAGCILSKFYIKPQHWPNQWLFGPSCILSKFYIKPQLLLCLACLLVVVSYRNSTSNHNIMLYNCARILVVSYRNSTSNHNGTPALYIYGGLYLIEILHQTTTTHVSVRVGFRCILSKFYIKPQRAGSARIVCVVVSYRNSTSNHNLTNEFHRAYLVVSYRNSTSNHNPTRLLTKLMLLYLIEILHQTTTQHQQGIPDDELYLIEILHQTTTRALCIRHRVELYLIEILHQATTPSASFSACLCCILSKFYIKPQRIIRTPSSGVGCILSKFYIKPQHVDLYLVEAERCILSKFYIKPQHRRKRIQFCAVVSYRNSTSNHNHSGHRNGVVRVVSYRNSTSNHNRLLPTFPPPLSCILSKFYIKPQHHRRLRHRSFCCILSKFYIKPQRSR